MEAEELRNEDLENGETNLTDWMKKKKKKKRKESNKQKN